MCASDARNDRNPLAQYLLLLAIFGVGFVGYLMRTTDWLRAIPGDLYDARFNSVVLEHLYQWVTGKAGSLWSPSFFYPFEGVLAYSDNHFGSGIFYVVLRAAGLDREGAYIGWFLAGCILNFIATYLVLRKLGFSVVAAGAGAFIFAFGLPSLVKEAHAQLTYRYPVPLAAFAFYSALQNRAPGKLVWVAVWCGVQFFCSIYIGIFLVYLLSGIAVGFAVTQRLALFRGWQQSWRAHGTAARLAGVGIVLGCAGAVGWLLISYRAIADHYGFVRTTAELLTMLPTPSSYLLADRSALSSWVGSLVPKTLMRHEQQMFVGIGPWLIAMLGLYGIFGRDNYRRLGIVAIWSLVFLVVLTLLVGNVTLYRALLHLPGISSVRAVSRVVLVMLFPFAILVAIGMDTLVSTAQRKRMLWLAVVCAVVLLTAESASYRPYNTPRQAWVDRQVAVRALLPPKLERDSILFVTGKHGPEVLDLAEVDAMILAQDLNLPTMNGYSGNSPPGFVKAEPCLHFMNRLNGYFDFKPRPGLSKDALASRVVVIGEERCPTEPVMVSTEAVSRDLASGLQIGVTGILGPPWLFTKVSITNNSGQRFSTWSTKGPVRFSWRFVRVSEDGKALDNPDFELRKDLNFSLDSGQTRVEELVGDLPPVTGLYRFEVTLVQDGVAWLHDLGLNIGSMLVRVP